MAYVVSPGRGLHFSFGPWPNCVVAAFDTGGVGEVVIVGTGAVGSEEYDAIQVIWGPGDLEAACNAAGGMGNFLVATIIPAANAVLKDRLNAHPVLPAINNSTPPSPEGLNIALLEYFNTDPSADGNYPIASFKPYP